MNKKIIIIIIIFITFIIIIISKQEKAVNDLVNPKLQNVESTPTPSPTPKTFQFNSATDLEKELESIAPKVLDSDFDE